MTYRTVTLMSCIRTRSAAKHTFSTVSAPTLPRTRSAFAARAVRRVCSLLALVACVTCIASIVQPAAAQTPILSIGVPNTSGLPTTVSASFRAAFLNPDGTSSGINVRKENIIIEENGKAREVLEVRNCGGSSSALKKGISATISFDISGSMFRSARPGNPRSLEMAVSSGDILLNQLNFTQDEVAIQWCDDVAVLAQDFTTSKPLARSRFPNPQPNGNNNFVEHLINPFAGLLNIAKRGKSDKQRIAVLMTDAFWYPLTRIELDQCIKICKDNDIRFYAIVFGPVAPSYPGFPFAGITGSFKEIANATGGRVFEDVVSNSQIEPIMRELRSAIELGVSPQTCEVVWRTAACDDEFRVVNMRIKTAGQPDLEVSPAARPQYFSPASKDSVLTVQPQRVFMKVTDPKKRYDTTITLIAPQTIRGTLIVDIKGSDGKFTMDPKQVRLDQSNRTARVKLTYTGDTTYSSAVFAFTSSDGSCERYMAATAGIPGRGGISELKLTYPNGGEKFPVYSTEKVTWTGIADSEPVQLEYTTDSGKTWQSLSGGFQWVREGKDESKRTYALTSVASNLRWLWDTVGNTPSRQCLMRVAQYEGDPSKIELDTAIFKRTNADNSEKPVFVGLEMLPTQTTIGGVGTAADEQGVLISVKNGVYTVNPRLSTANLPSSGAVGNLRGGMIGQFVAAGDVVRSKSDNGQVVVAVGDRTGGYSILTDGRWYTSPSIPTVTNQITALTINSDNPGQFFVGYDDGTIRVFEQQADGRPALVRALPKQHTGRINALRFIRNYNPTVNRSIGRFVSAGADGKICVWSVSNLETPLQVFQNATNTAPTSVTAVDIDPSGDIIVSGDADGKVKLWVTGASSAVALGNGVAHDAAVQTVRFDRNADYILSTGYKRGTGTRTDNLGAAMMWDVQSGALLKTLIRDGGERPGTYVAPSGALLQNIDSYPTDVVVGAFGFLSTKARPYAILGRIDGSFDLWYPKLPPRVVQYDVSDNVWSIIRPKGQTKDVDMGKMFVGDKRDSLVEVFIENHEDVELRITNIKITGSGASAFLSSAPLPLIVPPRSGTSVEFRFMPKDTGRVKANVEVQSHRFGKITTFYGDSTAASATITGEGISPAIRVVAEQSSSQCIDFGQVRLGSNKSITVERAIEILVDGVRIDSVINIGPSVSDYTIGSTQVGTNVQRGFIPLFATFIPQDPAGARSGGVRYYYTYNNVQYTATIRFCGEGVGAPGELVANALPSKEFAVQACDATTNTLSATIATIRNAGSSPLNVRLRVVATTPTANIASLVTASMDRDTTAPTLNVQTLSLAPNERRYVRVTFTPPAGALPEIAADVLIDTSRAIPPEGSQRTALTLRREAMGFVISRPVLPPRTVPAGGIERDTVTFYNTGTVPLTWAFPIVLPSGLTLNVVANSPTAEPALTLAPGKSATITVTMPVPSAEGVTMAFAAGSITPIGACTSATLGAATLRTTVIPRPVFTLGAATDLTTQVTRINCQPPIIVTPPVLFVSFTNTGVATMSVRLSFTGVDRAMFVLANSYTPAFDVAVGQTARIPICFLGDSKQDAARTYNANLVIDWGRMNTAGGGGMLLEQKTETVPLAATLLTTKLDVPPQVNLGNVDFGSTAPVRGTVVITNLGTAPFTPPRPPVMLNNDFVIESIARGTNADSNKYTATVRYIGSTSRTGTFTSGTYVGFMDSCATPYPITFSVIVGNPPAGVLALDTVKGRANDTVSVAIRLTGLANVRTDVETTIQGTLRYNASMLYPVDAAVRNASTINYTTGERLIPFTYPIPRNPFPTARDTVRIGAMRFLVMLGNNPRTALAIDNPVFGNGAGSTLAMAPGAFVIQGLPQADLTPVLNPMGAAVFTAVSLSPNPVKPSETVTFQFVADRDIPITFSISDATGAEYQQMLTGFVPPAQAIKGANTITFSAANLPAGIYFVNLRSTAMSVTRRLRIEP